MQLSPKTSDWIVANFPLCLLVCTVLGWAIPVVAFAIFSL